MNIVPISSFPYQSSSVPSVGGTQSAGNSFKSFFDSAISEFSEATAQKEQDTLALAMGEVDDIAAISANSLKAEVSLQLLVQMRNKLLDGYQEIMRLNV